MVNLFYGNSVPEGRWTELKLEEGEEPLCGVLQIMPGRPVSAWPRRTPHSFSTAYTPHCICPVMWAILLDSSKCKHSCYSLMPTSSGGKMGKSCLHGKESRNIGINAHSLEIWV